MNRPAFGVYMPLPSVPFLTTPWVVSPLPPLVDGAIEDPESPRDAQSLHLGRLFFLLLEKDVEYERLIRACGL